MPADKVELRGLCPIELAQALDAIAMAKGMDCNAFVVRVLASEVRRYLAEANVALRTLRGNPLLAESAGGAAQ